MVFKSCVFLIRKALDFIGKDQLVKVDIDAALYLKTFKT